MTGFAYFGYGSLVNVMTYPSKKALTPAQLTGWRRRWSHRVARPGGDGRSGSVALAVVETPGATLDGVISKIADDDEARRLDEREFGYDRRALPRDALRLDPRVGAPVDDAELLDADLLDADLLDEWGAFLYVSKPDHVGPGTEAFPIYRSYIDTVMQGYLRSFGADGLARFVDTTDGWDGVIVDDRAVPHYPRATRLSAAEQATIETALEAAIARDRGAAE